MKFSFIIPTVRQTTMVRDCIESLRRHEPDSNYEIIVVEDGSEKVVQEWLRAYCERSDVRLFLKADNRGFAHTVNVGMASARGDYLILLNNDVLITRPILGELERAFQRDDKIGVVGAKLLYPNNKIQHAGVVRIPNTSTFVHLNQHSNRDDPKVCQSKYFVSVTGALYAIRRDAFEDVGFFNENYFLACEDTEYSLRVWQAGWRVFYAADVEATHQEGGTRGNTDATKLRKGPQWFLKERETVSKFVKDFKKFDVASYERSVARLNASEATPEKPSRILLIRTGALGDVLLSTPIARRLRAENPNAVIDVATACPAAYVNNPHVNSVVRQWRKESYDQIVDLDLAYERDPHVHIIDAYSAVAFGDISGNKSTVLVPTVTDSEVVRRVMQEESIDPARAVVVHMAMTWKNRTWPKESWAQVVAKLLSEGCVVVQVGAGGDFSFSSRQGLVDLTNRLTIHQIADLIARSRCFVGNDSGLLHVAGTTTTPIVGLFTSVRADLRLPHRDGAYGGRCVGLEPEIDCKGCHHREPPPVTFSNCRRGDFACLGLIKPQAVVDAVLGQLEAK